MNRKIAEKLIKKLAVKHKVLVLSFKIEESSTFMKDFRKDETDVFVKVSSSYGLECNFNGVEMIAKSLKGIGMGIVIENDKPILILS